MKEQQGKRAWIVSHLSFYRIHVLYFLLLPLLLSGILFALNDPNSKWNYEHLSWVDSLFMSYSALTGAGLATVLLATMSPGQQAAIFIFFWLGSSASLSLVTLSVRLYYFRLKYRHFKQVEGGRRMAYLNDRLKRTTKKVHIEDSMTSSDSDKEALLDFRATRHSVLPSNPGNVRQRKIYPKESAKPPPDSGLAAVDTPLPPPPYQPSYGLDTLPNPLTSAFHKIVEAVPQPDHNVRLVSKHLSGSTGKDRTKAVDYLHFDVNTVDNSNLPGMTVTEQDEAGILEYRALKLLLAVVIVYSIAIPTIGAIIIAPWITQSPIAGADYATAMQTNGATINKVWYSFWQTASAFNNVGMSLIDASLVPFQNEGLYLLSICFLVSAGDSFYPAYLRLVLWVFCKLTPPHSEKHETLRFLLDHPRRHFVNLFPAYQTWFLVATLFALDTFNTIAFIILDIGAASVDALDAVTKFVVGFFGSTMVHNGGFCAISISSLAPSMHWLYLVAMYLGTYPLMITMRATNVYKHRALGVPMHEALGDVDVTKDPRKQNHYKSELGEKLSRLGYHIRWAVSFDAWWVVCMTFLICVFERAAMQDTAQPDTSEFSVFFEVSAGYTGVGLSLGRSDVASSLCGAFTSASKVVLMITMLRGRLRCLPVSSDRAVLLPQGLLDHADDLSAYLSAEAEADAADTHGTDSGSEVENEKNRRAKHLAKKKKQAKSGASGVVGSQSV